MSIVLFILCAVVVLWIWWIRYVKKIDMQLCHQTTGKPMPGPSPYFMGMNGLWIFLYRGIDGLEHECRKYGPVARIFIGPSVWVWVSGATEFQELMHKSSTFMRGGSLLNLIKTVLPNTVFTTEGQIWRKHRLAMNPFFSEETITKGDEEVMKIVQQECEDIEPEKPFYFVELTSRMTRKILLKLIFSYPPQPNKESIHSVKRGGGFSWFFFAWACSSIFIQFLKMKFVQKFLRKKFDGFGEMLKSVNNSPEVSKSLWAQLASNDHDTPKFSWEEYQDESVGLLAAGYETTATALCWVLLMLHKHPEVLKKLKTEIQNVIGDKIPTYSDTRKMPYLDKVIFESIRCNGIVTSLSREAVQRDTLGGYNVPAGISVYTSPRQVARDSFESPEKFDPERYNGENVSELMKLALLNFGNGPHVCVGKYLALMEIRLITTYLVQRGDIVVSNADSLHPATSHSPTALPKNLFAVLKKSVNS